MKRLLMGKDENKLQKMTSSFVFKHETFYPHAFIWFQIEVSFRDR